MKPIHRQAGIFHAALCLLLLPGFALAGVGLEHLSQATSAAGTIEIVPGGGGPRLDELGLTVQIQILDAGGVPISGFPAEDIWLGDAVNGTRVSLCAAQIGATGPSDSDGWTSLSGPISGGGFTDGGAQVYMAGLQLPYSPPLDIVMVSADLDGDLDVDLADLSDVPNGFAYYFLNSSYDRRIDFNGDGVENMLDLVGFAHRFMVGSTCP